MNYLCGFENMHKHTKLIMAQSNQNIQPFILKKAW